MIASLRGALLESGPDFAVVEVGGVGYSVTVTAAARRALPQLGATVFLLVYTHAVKDGPLQLYGFCDGEERRVFETLLSVQGVGPKVALAILSSLPLGDLVRAIVAADIATLVKIRGVGRKTAERIAIELRDKIGLTGREVGPASSLPAALSGPIGEVHAALTALGYRPSEFDAILSKLDVGHPVTELIKQALGLLRRR